VAVAVELAAEVDQQRVVARQSAERLVAPNHVDDRRLETCGARGVLAHAPDVREIHLASRDERQQAGEPPTEGALL
jgi:hypothetical protein